VAGYEEVDNDIDLIMREDGVLDIEEEEEEEESCMVIIVLWS